MFKIEEHQYRRILRHNVADNAIPKIILDMILKIHRGNDGYIAFTRTPNREIFDQKGRPKNFETLFSIRTDELETIFPQMQIYLLNDSYFSVNSYFKAAPYKNKLTKLPGVCRKEKDLRYLCACYADLDIYRPQEKKRALTFTKAVDLICNATEKGVILPPSMICQSGRGAYLLWLLRDDEKPDIPPRAWPETIMVYKQINKALGSRLTNLSWDPIAHDAARVLRVPGSYHSRAKKIVSYRTQLDQYGQPFAYTLKEMADFFEVPIIETPGAIRSFLPAEMPEYRVTKKRGSVPKRRNGLMNLNARRAEDFKTIMQHRGGINKGNRYMLLNLYAGFLRRFMGKCEATRELKKIASSCLPPYPSDHSDTPLSAIIDCVFNGEPVKKYRNATLCKWLEVTPELARELDLKTIVPDEVAKERKRKPGRQELQRQQRQATIFEVLKMSFDASIREVKKALENEGIKASLGTLQKELPLLRDEIMSHRLNEKAG